jgi:diguanylate cyclase (GGDEF)-like protein
VRVPKPIRKAIDYFHDEQRLLADNAPDVEATNRSTLTATYVIVMGAFLILSLGSLFSPLLHLVNYLPIIAALAVLIALTVTRKRMVSSKGLYVGGFVVLTVYCAINSGWFWPNDTTVLMLGTIFLFSTTVLVRSRVVAGVELGLDLLYLAIIWVPKAQYFFWDEFWNVVMFSLIGFTIGTYMRAVRLENIDLKRVLVEREGIDFLTGLGSRRALFDALIAQESPDEPMRYSGVAMIDVDDFKLLNDTYGHQAGDICLQGLGKSMLELGADGEVSFYRYGGEEFVALFYGGTISDMEGICNRLIDAAHAIELPGVDEPAVSLSIGLTRRPVRFSPEREGYERLLHEADVALYEAKDDGKNRVETFSSDMGDDAVKNSFRTPSARR